MMLSLEKRTQHTTGRTVDKIVSQLCGGRAIYTGIVNIDKVYRLDLDTAWMDIEDKLLQKVVYGEIPYEKFMALGVIDRSGSMEGGPDCAAVGLGLLMSRVTAKYELETYGKTLFGDRVLRFSCSSDVIVLDVQKYPNFSDYLAEYFRLENAYPCGYNTRYG